MERKIQTSSLDGDVVEQLVENKGEEVRGKYKKSKQEQKRKSKTSESSEDEGAAMFKGKEENVFAKKVTVNNSKVQKCPLCKVKVTHLRRHVVALHVNKGERLAMSQLESILQAAIHGEEKRGKERLETRLGKKVSFKGRVREKCPLCDKSVLAITTHLQLTHNLKKDDSIYKNAMVIIRQYEGKTKEVKSCKRKAEDQTMASQAKKRPLTPLGLLIQADFPNLMEVIIPPTPDKQGRLMLKASVVERRITEEENFNGGGERVEENNNGEDKKKKKKKKVCIRAKWPTRPELIPVSVA